MWYFILYLVIAIWVFIDAWKRQNSYVVWALPTVVIGPLVLPVYLAKRNLKAGEVREGGMAWNILKNFAVLWTLTMIVAAIAGMVGVSEMDATSEAEQAGQAIGAALGLGMLGFLWFIVLVGALVLGFFLKNTSIVEKGPTGPLAAMLLAFVLVMVPGITAAQVPPDVKQNILQHCQSQMGEFGPLMVKSCVDMDIGAYTVLRQYDQSHQDIIQRCEREMLWIGGWAIVKACVDQDIAAQKALDAY